jgi:hypothetical protein
VSSWKELVQYLGMYTPRDDIHIELEKKHTHLRGE